MSKSRYAYVLTDESDNPKGRIVVGIYESYEKAHRDAVQNYEHYTITGYPLNKLKP